MDQVKPNERNKAVLLLVCASVMWSTGGFLIKMVSWNPLAIAGARSAISAVTVVFILKKPKISWSLHQVLGAFFYAGTVMLFVIANKLTTASNAILLQYTAPIYIAILGAWLLKERTSALDWVTIAIAIGGMGLFFLDKLSTDGLLGNFFAIISGVCFASLTICLRKQKNASPVETILLGNIITAVIGIPFLYGESFEMKSVAGVVLLGVVQLGIPYVLYSVATKYVSALDSVLIPILEPILNPVWVFLLMGERPGPCAVIGGVVVLGSIAFRAVYRKNGS